MSVLCQHFAVFESRLFSAGRWKFIHRLKVIQFWSSWWILRSCAQRLPACSQIRVYFVILPSRKLIVNPSQWVGSGEAKVARRKTGKSGSAILFGSSWSLWYLVAAPASVLSASRLIRSWRLSSFLSFLGLPSFLHRRRATDCRCGTCLGNGSHKTEPKHVRALIN